LALNQAAREELRLMDEIKLMLRAVWMMIWGKNVRLVRLARSKSIKNAWSAPRKV